MKKRYLKSIIFVIFIISIIYLFFKINFLFKYQSALEESNSEHYYKDYIPLEFSGKVIKLSYLEVEEGLVTIGIDTQYDTLTYGLRVSKKSEFFKFVEKGDSVIKRKGFSTVKFIKSNGRQKSFKLPF